MEQTQWLVIQLFDERWDFNLHIKSFFGTLEELADDEMKPFEEFKPYGDEWFVYSVSERRAVENYIDIKLYDSKNIENVAFETILCCPVNKINWNDLYLSHPVVSRNVKYGFLDLKNGGVLNECDKWLL